MFDILKELSNGVVVLNTFTEIIYVLLKVLIAVISHRFTPALYE